MKEKKERKGRNPATGEDAILPATPGSDVQVLWEIAGKGEWEIKLGNSQLRMHQSKGGIK